MIKQEKIISDIKNKYGSDLDKIKIEPLHLMKIRTVTESMIENNFNREKVSKELKISRDALNYIIKKGYSN